MWQLHENIHQAWIDARPSSVTARVAQADFFVEYAWHARTAKWAEKVTPEGWRLFGERLQTARQLLAGCRAQGVKCPGWWSTGLTVGLGLEWPHATYEQFYTEAKAFEPAYWYFDTARSKYLARKWYGQPGEWEAAAESAAAAPGGLGMEIYSRCLLMQVGNYQDVFKESRASWAKARQGFELMEQRYPRSLEIVGAYCRMACAAGDQATAKQLFARLGENGYSDVWTSRDYWQRCREWAGAAQPPDLLQRLRNWVGNLR